MNETYARHLAATLAQIESDGLFKLERILGSPQGPRIAVVPPPGTGPAAPPVQPLREQLPRTG